MPDWANDHTPHGHGPPGPQNMVMPQPGQPQSNASMPPRGPQNEYSGFYGFLFYIFQYKSHFFVL
jgi:hypothetical protein